MQKIWHVRPFDREIVSTLARELNISPVLGRILANRKITTVDEARQFLFGDVSTAYDPFLLKGMDMAVARIGRALEAKERIMAYGDYDVDGITSVALLKIIMDELGGDCITYIPNRLDEGYGLNVEAIKFAHSKGVKLIITADCGIDAYEEVVCANSLGIDVIITDHHAVKKELIPPALSVINPHQHDCAYPFKHLAGVGVVYKLSQALMKRRFYPLEQHLDLVALGTVSDIVPQHSENRIFTKRGIEEIRKSQKPGIQSLLAVSGLKDRALSTSHIGFALGPRINAMGRIGSPEIALDLLLTDNKLEADRIAGILNRENTGRQKIEADILEAALAKVEREVNFKDHRVIVLSDEGWHAGVIGIVASRIQERYYRPTIMITVQNGVGKGSGRSIDKFNLFNALQASRDSLIDFGGHEAACGLSIDMKNIDVFREKINDYARQVMRDTDFVPSLDVDIEMPLAAINQQLIDELDILEPFGPGNPRPVFSTPNITLQDEPRYVGKNGVKVWIRNRGSLRTQPVCEAISFKRNAMTIPNRGDTVDLAYTLGLNTWQGITSIQLELKDLRICTPSAVQ
ncbi:MAG: single-stranded-DNA-specific exonuclease RecJ [Candidatus Omnitrophica bacterium]|nr:single-stranded-DNA-specific exonuclease RecJ [Candidatus Omnitrophota bacterium]